MYKDYDSQLPMLMDIYQETFGYITTGRLVEVGAFNCYNWSNTYPLLSIGWSGLLIEPQANYFENCYKLYDGNNKVILEQCCVGKECGVTHLYLGGSNTTIKRKMVDIYNSLEWSKISGLNPNVFIDCEIHTLDCLLSKHDFKPNFEVLSIDVEGAEIDVLKGFTISKYLPKLVIIETHEKYPDSRLARKSRWINTYFFKYGYTKIHSDIINSIYRL